VLNKELLFKEVAQAKERLFVENASHLATLHTLWNTIASNSAFKEKAAQNADTKNLTTWPGNLNDTQPVSQEPLSYVVRAVDGSQIYPDRNMPGAGCFLINVGGIKLEYDTESSASFFSKPTLYLPGQNPEGDSSKDFVDLKREELELEELLNGALREGFSYDATKKPHVCLFDGSLIFWHLESKSIELQQEFLTSYLSYLQKLYENRILIAGCISLPRSRDLINLIKFEIESSRSAPLSTQDLLAFVDSDVLSTFLGVNQRSTVFKSNSNLTRAYPENVAPYFFYCNVGYEILRVEIPAWIAQSQHHVTTIARIIFDQARKGYGYPISLAEAHEQAVIKGADRDFFYHLIMKMGFEHNKHFALSQKSLKKRGVGV
jgi:hypothetical protein